MPRVVQYHATSVPEARSVLYRLFAIAFSYPDDDLFTSFRDGGFAKAVIEAFRAVPYPACLMEGQAGFSDRLREALGDMTREELKVHYVSTFEAGSPEPLCPPYEGLHRKGETRTAAMLRISEFYKHFGLGMSQDEDKRELPDHLCAELEFLYFLVFKEAQAQREENEELRGGYLLAQRDFLERHLAKWVPHFFDKLQRSSGTPFYIELAGLLSGFISLDLGWVNTALSGDDTAVQGLFPRLD